MERAVGLGIVASVVIVASVGTQAFLVIVALAFLGIVARLVTQASAVQLEQPRKKQLPIIILSLPEI